MDTVLLPENHRKWAQFTLKIHCVGCRFRSTKPRHCVLYRARLIMNAVLPSPTTRWGRNGFDGITGLKMRAEDHGLVKNMELKLTADQPLALAA